VKVGRDGVLTGKSVGFADASKPNQKNQFEPDRHGKSYDDNTKGWERGDERGGEGRPDFDRGHSFKAPHGLKARTIEAKPASNAQSVSDYRRGRITRDEVLGLGFVAETLDYLDGEAQ